MDPTYPKPVAYRFLLFLYSGGQIKTFPTDCVEVEDRVDVFWWWVGARYGISTAKKAGNSKEMARLLDCLKMDRQIGTVGFSLSCL